MERARKICAACGLVITPRRRGAASWDEVRYCSRRCRGASRAGERRLEQAVLELLAARSPGTTACPSEVARRLRPDGWRELMEPVRRAARRLAHEGRLEILQGGTVVDPTGFRGPIRLRLVDRPAERRP